jgi:hypothetical protein
MRTWLKYTLLTLAGLIVLLLLLSLAGRIYLNRHKAAVIAYIKKEAAENLHADISIGDLSAGLFHTFPEIGISIDNLHIRDSLWSMHRHDLLNARRIYAGLDLFQLITGHARINRLILEDAFIYIYTDSSGYTNTSAVFKKENPSGSRASGPAVHYPRIEIRNTSLIIEKKDKHKFFSFDIRRLVSRIKAGKEDPGRLSFDINLLARTRTMAFNLSRGSFIEGKLVSGRFGMQFNTHSKLLQFNRAGLNIDGQMLTAEGKFFLAEKPALFMIVLQTSNLSFQQALSFLPENIRSKLGQYDISDRISQVSCTLDGTDSGYRTPLINIRVRVRNRSVHTPLADLEKTSFDGSFTNERVKGMGHEDENSLLHFTNLDGTWQDIRFHSDSLLIRNLIQPELSCNIRSRFRLNALNDLMDEGSLHFDRGSGKIAVLYKGPLTGEEDIGKWLSGELLLDSAAFTYLPRNFELENGRGRIRFAGPDMLIEGFRIHTGSTDLEMNGSMKNLFSLTGKPPDALSLSWDIRSNRINLNDFRNFLKKRPAGTSGKKKKLLLSQTISRITRFLETASMSLNLRAGQLSYKRFSAANLLASLDLNNDIINIRDIRLNHAGGSIKAQGFLRNDPHDNPFSLQATLDRVDLSRMLDAFDNFGQQAITGKNIRGALTAGISLQGELTQKAELIADSTSGSIDFNLQQGQLIGFEPLQKISQTLFRNRNFSDIRFADLHDRFDVRGNTITINRMEIHATVMTMFVEGQYNMKKGADLSIQVPLSNLKNQETLVPENQGIHSKTGVSARLRVKNGDDGKLKISWDPFKKAVREMKKKK